MAELIVCRTADARPELLLAARSLMDVAFEQDYDDEDWDHGLGGWHVLALDGGDGHVLAHAAVVERSIGIDEAAFRCGYVESVATHPDAEGTGIGTQVMEAVNGIIRRDFELGRLGTGRHSFYERLGWQRWQGHSYVRRSDGILDPSPDDDDGVMVLRFGPSADAAVTGSIVCEERPGDDW